MSLLELVLVSYGRFYVRNLPEIRRRHPAHLDVMAAKITELLGGNPVWQIDHAPEERRYLMLLHRDVRDSRADLEPLFTIDVLAGTVTLLRWGYTNPHYKSN